MSSAVYLRGISLYSRLSVIIDHLKIDTTKGENPILLAIPSWWNRLDREKITQIFFERFYVPGLYLADTALMTLYGFGQHLTGIVINLYEDRFVVTPVLDTAVQKNAVMNVPIGFREVRKYLRKLLKEDTYLKESLAGDDIDENLLKYIEENVCEVSQVPLEQELAKGLKERQIAKSEFSFNGKTLAIGSAKYRALEAYFNPKLIDQQDFRSLTHAVNDSVSLCDVDRRALLFENVVINGSMGELKGLNERFEKEMSRYIPLSDFASENQPRNIKFGRFPRFLQKLKDKPEYASWLGGSIVAKVNIKFNSFLSKFLARFP